MNISTKTSTEVTETTIKEVSTELNINKKHVKTHVKLDVDGKTILDEDGHSILANFGRYMEFLMCGTTPIAKPSFTFSRTGVVSRGTGGSAGKLVVTFPSTQYLEYYPELSKTISLYVPDYPNIHLIPIGITSASTYSPYTVTCDFDISSTDYDGLIGESVICCAYYTAGFKLKGRDGAPGIYKDSLSLLVGVNDAAVTIDDIAFHNVPSNLLTQSSTSTTITSDASTDETYLTASCSYTNATDAPVVIREIGLKANAINPAGNYNTSGSYRYYGLKLLIARDVIDEVTIPVGRTLNVTYTIMSKIAKSTGTGGANTDSGFTNNFLIGIGSVLASQLSASVIRESGSSSSLPSDSTSYYGDWLFCGSSIPSCKNRLISTRLKLGAELDTWRPGVLLCSGANDTQDVTNHIPVLEIPNGTGTGELEYLMSWGEEGTLDSTSYSFTLKRLVRNSSGADIEVKALALISNVYSITIGALASGNGMLLAQTNLDPTDFFTIPNGKMCIVSYTIKVEV